METYIPSHKTFEQLISQQGGSIDRFIFQNQDGNGLANMFSKLYRMAKPFIRSSIKAATPALTSIGSKLIDAGSKAAVSNIENYANKANKKLKRKLDNLDVQV